MLHVGSSLHSAQVSSCYLWIHLIGLFLASVFEFEVIIFDEDMTKYCVKYLQI